MTVYLSAGTQSLNSSEATRVAWSLDRPVDPRCIRCRLDTSRLSLIKRCPVKDGFPGTSATDRLCPVATGHD